MLGKILNRFGRGPAQPLTAREAQRKAELIDDYKHVFQGKAGQRVLADLLSETGFFEVADLEGPVAALNARRAVGSYILQMVEYDEVSHRRLFSAAAALERNRPVTD